MSTFTILLIAALFIVFVASPLNVLSLWLAAKIFRVAATLGKTTVVFLTILAASVPLAIGHAWLSALPAIEGSESTSLAIAIIALVIGLFVPWFLIRRGFETSGVKAAGILVVSTVIELSVSFLLAIALRTWVVEAFVVPTGAMAPTIVGFHSDVTCPNCGITFAVRRGEVGMRSQSGRLDCCCPNCGKSFDVSDGIVVRSGDRILADKTSKPRRGELVIYWVAARPEINAPATDYVKRLVGLRGEKLAILDGDVFINGERLVNRPDELMDLWFPLHDSKFVPKEVDATTACWKVQDGKGWSLDGACWRFEGGPAATGELTFDGNLTDRTAYNVESPDFRLPPQAEHPVGDIRIDCKRRLSGQGKWTISWDFGGQTVLADFSTDGDIDLTRKSAEELAGMVGVPTTRHGKLAEANEEASTVSLAVRDGHAYVMEGDYNHVRASLQIAPDKLSDVHTQSESKPGRLTIHAEGDCKLELERIQIFRDVYYTQPHNRAGDGPYSIELGRDEWFVLGDNSATSADSRYTGPFKTDAFVGIARFRYWPPSRWHSFQ